MAKEAFLRIQEAEAQARALIESAKGRAEQTVRQAEAESADALLRLKEEKRRQAAEKRRQAEAEAGASSAAYAEETAALCAALEERLRSQTENAVDAIIQSILS